jgi:hypothetical protein
MEELAANALTSMPMPKKAMTQAMGRLGKIRLRPSQRDFFPAGRAKCAPTSKIRRAPDSLRSNYCPGSKLSLPRSADLEMTTAASAAASRRSVRTEIQNLRGGNDARWKTPKAGFPPRLEIGQKAPDSHIFHRVNNSICIPLFHKLSRSPPSAHPLTDAGHFGQDPSASVASLRS